MIKKVKEFKKNKLVMNILFNFIFKSFGIGLSFISIPIMLKYLDRNNYGFWILILSITNWIYTFDIGIGNGLKNRLAESLGQKNDVEAKEYIATSYFFVTIISVVFLIISRIGLNNIDLSILFNIKFLDNKGVNKIIFINIVFVCANFILGLCNNIFLGSQKSYLSSINSVLSQILNVIFLLILFHIKKNSIILLSYSYGVGILLSHISLSIFYFYKNKSLLFNIKSVALNKVKKIFGIGIKIFCVQISSLIIFSTDNFIIAKYTGLENVATYTIVNKYFGIPILAMSLISTPIWPAITKAYYEGKKEWIKNILMKLKKIFGLILLVTIIMIVSGKSIIKIWTLNKIVPSLPLIIVCGASTVLVCFSNIYSTIIFGIGVKWNIVLLSLFQAVINVVVSLVSIEYFNLGVVGVVLGTCFSMLTNLFILPKILKEMINEM